MADATPEFSTSEASDATAPDDTKKADRAAVRKLWLTRLALAVVVLGLLWAAWYLLIGRNHVSTDNAYVNAEMAQVTPLIHDKFAELERTVEVRRTNYYSQWQERNREEDVSLRRIAGRLPDAAE